MRFDYTYLAVMVLVSSFFGCSREASKREAEKPRSENQTLKKTQDESKKSVEVRKLQDSPKVQPKPEGTVPPTEPAPVRPQLKAEMQLWRERNIGRLGLRISQRQEPRKTLNFPNRDYTVKLDDLLEWEKKDITDGRFDLRRLRGQYTPKDAEQGVELTFYLISDSEDTWPGKSIAFDSQIWGVRRIQAKDSIRVLSYDLQLKGDVQERGAIQGIATGRVRLDIELPWIVFEGAPFELMPWRVEEGK